MRDPYLYPNTNILKNLANMQNIPVYGLQNL